MNSNRSADSAIQTWPAPAKLNLFLHIVARREDGCHVLQSLVQFIDFCDQLSFSIRSDGEIQCENSNDTILQHEDLSVRAAMLLRQSCAIKQGVTIKIKKTIPLGAGLGGGSSDAATTLLALNRMWHCRLELKELEHLAGQLGADVPVFVRGAASWVEGTGELLEPVTLPEPWYVMVFPGVSLNTRKMFAHPDLTRDCTPITIREFTRQRTCNVFEPIARRQHLQIERAFQWLNRYSRAKLTGSGSALFAAFDTQRQAREISASCPREFTAHAVKGLNRSPAYSLL